ncbi:MAG: PhoH family protein [Clostridia bacterium]|nr:PhoH family protein [Clostridia bacterium]
MAQITKNIAIISAEYTHSVLGNYDENVERIMTETATSITVEADGLKVSGEEAGVLSACAVIEKMLALIEAGETVDKSKVTYLLSLEKEGSLADVEQLTKGVIAITAKGKPVKCKTLGQKRYVDEIRKNVITFGVGPAGTGKTYLAVALAVSAYKDKQVEKIILTRPAVEAGESLGYLPGDLQSKVDPYLRPLYDALQEMFGLETYQKLMERGAIEVAPLAYMRGRTLSNAFIILDEAQNATKEQMKMVLTRMGEGSKMIVTGDVTQIDLPKGKASGLIHATQILEGIQGIAVVRLTAKDVVRHPLVMEIIKAYAKNES